MNTFKMRKWGAFAFAAFIPTTMFFLALITWGLFYAYLFFAAGAVLSVVIGGKLINHPMMQMIEGSGLMILTIDSTGLIKPYLAKVNPPFLHANILGRIKTTVFDRNTINYLAQPQTAEVKQDDDGKNITINLPKEGYSNKLFSFSGAFPVLIYNTILGEER